MTGLRSLLRRLYATFAALVVAVLLFCSNSAAGEQLNDYQAISEFLRVTLDQNGASYSSDDAQRLKRAFRTEPTTFKIWGSKYQACPTNWWYSTDSGDQKEAQNSLKKSISIKLKSFPKSTLKKCTEVSAIFADGQPTSHWRNKKMFWTNVTAIAIKDLRSNEITLARALLSSNLSDNIRKKETHLYNENLELVCSFRNIDMKNLKASVDCGGLGSGKAIGERKGGTTIFTVVTPKAAIFATLGMSLEEAKRRFPEIFR
jgi:hypothetical protein